MSATMLNSRGDPSWLLYFFLSSSCIAMGIEERGVLGYNSGPHGAQRRAAGCGTSGRRHAVERRRMNEYFLSLFAKSNSCTSFYLCLQNRIHVQIVIVNLM
jgi:hypothetical protein